MLGKSILVFAVLSAFALKSIEGKLRVLQPISASVVRQLLEDAGREDAVPEGRVISHGLVAVKGLALGLVKGIAGVALADSLAASSSNNTASTEPIEVCFSTEDGMWHQAGNRKSRQSPSPTTSPTGTPTGVPTGTTTGTTFTSLPTTTTTSCYPTGTTTPTTPPTGTTATFTPTTMITATPRASGNVGQREGRQTATPSPTPTLPTTPPTSPTSPTATTTVFPTTTTTCYPISTYSPTTTATLSPTSTPVPVPVPTTTTATTPPAPMVSCVILYKNGQSSNSKI